jgi:hypothetical protein
MRERAATGATARTLRGVCCVSLALAAGGAALAGTPPPLPIACGDRVEGSIDAGEEDLFSFTGSAGDDVVLTLLQDGTWPFSTAPLASLFEPGAATPFHTLIEPSLFSTLFDSAQDPGLGVSLARATSSILAGTNVGSQRYSAVIGDFPPPVSGTRVLAELATAFGPEGTNTLFSGIVSGSPLVPLVSDEDDADEGVAVAQGLDVSLSEAQEALLGCGALQSSDCDVDGVDLAQSDASVLLQAFPGGGIRFDPDWDTADPSRPQPGTVDALFNDGPGLGADLPDTTAGALETEPVATSFENGQARVAPGARWDPVALLTRFASLSVDPGAADPIGEVDRLLTEVLPFDVDPFVTTNVGQYDVAVDGTAGCATASGCRRHPFTGQPFASELAGVSWNLLMLMVGLGGIDGAVQLDTLDRAQPLALGRCSYLQPQYCIWVALLASHLTRGGHVTLSVDGTYTIAVRASSIGSGPYTLELTCPTPTPTATPTPTPTPQRVTLCHQRRTPLRASVHAVAGHIRHGDALGECPRHPGDPRGILLNDGRPEQP